MKCEEVDGLDLKEGAVRIFFNTRGKNSEEVSQDLVELLDFMENTTEQAGARSKNEKIRRKQEQVHRIKSSEEMGVRYMQEWEEKAMEREKEREIVLEQMNSLIKILLEQGRSEELLRATKEEEYREELFKEFGIE